MAFIGQLFDILVNCWPVYLNVYDLLKRRDEPSYLSFKKKENNVSA